MNLSTHISASGKIAGALARALRLPRVVIALAVAVMMIGGGALAFVLFAGKPAAEASVSELGVAYMDDGDYRRAAETLRAAYRINPTEDTKVALARALLGSGDYAGVLELLKADETPESTSRYGYLRAEAMMRAEHYGDARAMAAELLAANPSDGRSMLVSARALYGLGDTGAAAEFLSRALRARDGALGEAWLFRARMALDANDVEAAEGALARAKDAAVPARNLALFDSEARLRSGDFAGAREALPAAARKKRSKRAPVIDAQREYALARIDAASGDYLTAARRIRAIRPALAGEPNSALVAGLIQEASGDKAQAENEYRSALALAPNDAALLDALAAMLIRAKRSDDAMMVVNQLAEASPYLGAMRRMAIYSARGDNDSVLAAARRLASADVAPTAAAVAFGQQSDLAKKDAVGLADATALAGAATALGGAHTEKSALALAAFGEPVAFALAGDLYFAAGDDAAAAASFDKALAMSPHFEAALEGRLRVYVRSADLGGAQAWLFSVIATDADNRAARVALARVLRKDGRKLEAAAALSPAAGRLHERPRDALLYGDLLASIGATAEIENFARGVRRHGEAASLATDILARAGRLESASLAARDALADAPANEQRAEDYISIMIELGKAPEATAFLTALVQRRPDAKGAESALARLAAGEISRAAIRDAGSAPTAEIARKAYLDDPSDPLAASRFGRMLLASGARDAGIRVLREACFFSLEGQCREAAPHS